MLTHWAVSILCKIIPVISLMKMKFSFLFTSRDFFTNCNGLVNSKVLCATQITLASESKIVSHGSTVSPKKRQSLITKFITKKQFAAISHYASKIRSYYEYYF